MSDGQSKLPFGELEQSIKQRLFVEWLYEKLQIPIQNRVYIDKRSGKKSSSLQFQTRSKGFRSMWYKPLAKRKSLPSSIDCFFSIPFVTVWFAGDGTKLKRSLLIGQRGAKFEVTYFTPEERLKLKQLFKLKFNINAKILRAGQSKKGLGLWSPKGGLAGAGSHGHYQFMHHKFRTLITQMDLISRIFPYKLCKKKFDPLTTLYFLL